MDYKNQVQEKITASAVRQEQRSALWNQICSSYEQGGMDQVESNLNEEMAKLKRRFDEVISAIEQML